MNRLKQFLHILKKNQYPSDKTHLYAEFSNYNINNFTKDLINEIGEKKTLLFVEKALRKLYEKDNGIKISLYNDGSYAYIIIDKVDLVDGEFIEVSSHFGKSHILMDTQNTFQSLDQIGDDVDMGEWAEYDSLLDSIKSAANTMIYNKTGFELGFN